MDDDNMNTQPMIEALFARLDEWGLKYATELASIRTDIEAIRTDIRDLQKGQEELRAGQEELRAGQQELRKCYEELRSDLNTGLRRVERKIEILNDNLLTMKADIRDLEIRVEKLESERLG
jgi:chromosome segregation ATPase